MDNQGFHTVRGYEIIGKKAHRLSHSMEDYLEMIYRHSLEEGYVRINTLAEALHVQPPSATKMVQKLGKLGLLHYEKYGVVLLTGEGERLGKFLLKRHQIIETFLKNIGVEQKLLVNVELIEHSVTTGALEQIEVLNNFFKVHPEILEMYKHYRVSTKK
ncbi:MAG: iron dependent repressor, metal binding and dimerization domain protein [Pelotomaculum sp.]